jgi:phage anti-repressor protein
MSKMNEKTIDIVKLVQDHPLMKISGENNPEIVNKIKEKFTDQEQHMFVANFYCYLNYDARKDFIIELDNIWKWLGFGKKGDCKNLLSNNFKENEDYRVEKLAAANAEASFTEQHGGQNKENILMTIHCFKKLCLKAKTKKSDEIHDYYIKLEEVMNEVVSEQAEQLRNQLQIKDKKIQSTMKENQDNLLINFDKKSVDYIIEVEKFVRKFGMTNDIYKRMMDHRLEFGQDIKLVYIFETVYNREFEMMIKKDKIIQPRIFSKIYKTNQTELIGLDENFTHDNLISRLNELKKHINGDLIANLMKENEELKLVISAQKLEIVDKDAKIAKLYRVHSIDTIDFPLISTDIKTKKEIEFDTLTKVQFQWKTSITTLMHYIDKHKQYKGCILRSGRNKAYWTLPDNFKYSDVVGQTIQNVFIKRIDKISREITYYNSITEASLFLQQEIDHKEITEVTEESGILRKAIGELLRGYPTRKDIINKYHWYRMNDIGFIVNTDGTKTNIDEHMDVIEDIPEKVVPILPPQEYTDKMFEEKVPIIVRNIHTGEETVYPEGYVHITFHDNYKITKNTLHNKFLNKHLNYMNLTFRIQGMPYWQIPNGYVNDDEAANIRLGYFIKVEDIQSDNIKTYYFNSITGIAAHLFPNDPKVRNLDNAIKKKFSKDDPNKIDKSTNKGIHSSILSNYKWTKLESCGSLVYPDGRIVDIEKLLS